MPKPIDAKAHRCHKHSSCTWKIRSQPLSYGSLEKTAILTQLYISVKCNTPLASLIKLNNCISDIRVWMINNKLKINDSKTEFIVFRSPQAKQDLSGLSVIVGDSIIQQSSKVRNLGIIFDQFLSFDDYISSVCRSTHFHLRNIGRIRHLLSQNVAAQLIHALISIRLDYCNSILYNLPKNSILRLQIIQNQAARVEGYLYSDLWS